MADVKVQKSFPQLKYPSKRDDGMKGYIQWLEGKAEDDGAESLWRIHNKLYDLNDFINRHPGGKDWIELTKGTDITEAFESHHIYDGAKQLLPKFYVRDAKTARNSPFTFEDDGFYKTLRVRIRKELDKIAVKNYESKSHVISDGLLASVLVLLPLMCFVNDFYALSVLVVISGIALSCCTISTHNYFHKKDNWRMYLWNLSTMSYREWRVSHAISHHLFPNTLLDIEISDFEPYITYLPKAKPFLHYAVAIYSPVIMALLFWIQGLKKIVMTLTMKDYFKKYIFWHDAIPIALPLWMLIVSGAPISKILTIWFATLTITSFVFAYVGVISAHHHPSIFHDGDEPINTTLDWGLHQIEAVMDCKEKTGSLFFVLVSFGDHALHHLFPTLDHAVLPLLYKTFYEVCEEYNTKHRIASQADLVLGQYLQLYRTQSRKRGE